MKSFLQNKITAVVALILAIIISLTVGVNRSVGKLADNVENVYLEGDAKYGSVQQDINKLSEYLYELMLTASADINTEIIYETSESLQEFAESPFSADTKVLTVCDTVSNLYNRLLSSDDMTVEESKNIIQSLAEIQSIKQRLKNNKPYNEAASEYNDVLNSFPADIFDFTHKPAVVFN